MGRHARAWVTLGLAAMALVLAGCSQPKDAIGVSEVSHDFRSSRQSWNLKIWNTNGSVSSLDFAVAPTQPWIHVSPKGASSKNGNDVKIVTVSVSRAGLAIGTHEGALKITAKNVVTVSVPIKCYSDGSEGVASGALNIVGVSQTYTAPYLMDFVFSLRDTDNRSVIGEPIQFGLACREDGVPVSEEENPPLLAKASAKQLQCYLVLDYSASMASTQVHGDSNHDGKSDAIETMENSIKQTLLPSLSADALVGVYEFHREKAPEKVCDLSADKTFVAQRIDAIWTQFVNSYWGPSRLWDAVYAAVNEFGPENRNDEVRNVIFISDGRDTSSRNSKEDVIAHARDLGIRLYAIGFGTQADVATLQSVTEQTQGQYYSALAVQDLPDSFLQIVDDFDGQYALRWATLVRTNSSFTPSFLISLGMNAASFTSQTPFAVAEHAGDELVGTLRVVPSVSNDKSTYFLRASYVPRYVWKLRFYVESPFPFTVSKADVADNGLCAAWSIDTSVDAVRGGTWVRLESPDPGAIDTPIPFASFGPILQFEFDEAFADDMTPFDVLYIDNSLYTAGQSFVIQGYDNILPPA